MVLVACFFSATTLFAQVRVTKSAGAKSTIDLSGLQTASDEASLTFRRTLENDLKRSGWFSVVRGSGAFRVVGSCEPSWRSLQAECRVYNTVKEQTVLSKAFKGDPKEPRTLAHRVADEIVQAVTGYRGIASTRIVMVGTRTGAKELYLCDADGGSLIQLTHDKTVSVAPHWGPAGSKLIYTSYLKRFPDVFLIDVDSGKRTRAAGYPGLNTGGALAPNGRDMAVILSKDGNPELYIKDLNSDRLTRITRTSRAVEASPCWSPDGRQIVYVSDQSGRPHLYVVSSRGGAPRRLTMRGSENVAPDWGPNGLIAYASRLGGRYRISLIDPQTRQETPLALDYADYEDPSWAPDGRHLACTRTQSYRARVYILDTMGDPPIPLTEYQGDWYSPAWSPQ
jgi:TolB protein